MKVKIPNISYKLVKNILTLLTVSLLLSKPCQAFELPFFKKEATIIFEDKAHQKQLGDLIKTTIKTARQEREEQKVVLDKEQIALLEKNLIEKLLHSQGFYDGAVEYKIDESSKEQNTYQVNPRKPYLIKKVTIKSNSKNIKFPSTQEFIGQLNLAEKSVLLADNVLLAQQKLIDYAAENYCLWQIKINYQVLINRQNKEAEIVFSLQPSDEAKFGEVNFTGLETIKESYIKNKIQIEKNSCFKKSVIDKAKLDLLKTGLFADVQTMLDKTVDQIVNIDFVIKERHHKTIKAGVAFNADEGVILTTGWEHRNSFGKAQDFQINLSASRLSQIINSSLTIPSFFSPKQSLIIGEELARKTFDSFDANSSNSSITLKRKLAPYLTGGIGSELKLSHVKDNISTENFRLLSTPITLEYDKRNRDFNPDSGLFIAGRTAPYIDLINDNEYFTKSTAVGTYYHKAESWFLKPVFAFKLSAGSINHIKESEAPADEQFYVGGANSVRGYGFQKAGIIINGDPAGGLSFIETSLETRLKFSQDWAVDWAGDWGMVVFIDGGNNFIQTTPNLKTNLKWAGGFGVRYFTGFLPIRVDIAFPFDKRSKIDSAFQLYIGIGQAF
jgi:translocation and assembly module TamA